jgi:hypothetical protein
MVSRAGIEPATRRLLTTLALTSRYHSERCSLDYLITRLFIGLGVRRIVSEGFLETK